MSDLKPCDCNNPFHDCNERAGCRVIAKLDRAQPAITSESGNQAAQGASAITSVPLLSDDLDRELVQSLKGAVEMGWISDDSRTAIEQAVRAKMGTGVPSDEVCDKDPRGCWNVRCQLGKVCKNAAAHGIVGKEGGNV